MPCYCWHAALFCFYSVPNIVNMPMVFRCACLSCLLAAAAPAACSVCSALLIYSLLFESLIWSVLLCWVCSSCYSFPACLLTVFKYVFLSGLLLAHERKSMQQARRIKLIDRDMCMRSLFGVMCCVCCLVRCSVNGCRSKCRII